MLYTLLGTFTAIDGIYSLFFHSKKLFMFIWIESVFILWWNNVHRYAKKKTTIMYNIKLTIFYYEHCQAQLPTLLLLFFIIFLIDSVIVQWWNNVNYYAESNTTIISSINQTIWFLITYITRKIYHNYCYWFIFVSFK